MKILIGVDDSEFSRAAVASVANRPWPENTQVNVVFVVDNMSDADYARVERNRNQYEIARKAIDNAFETLKKSQTYLRINGEIIEGSAKQALLDEADKWGADLLVVGSHGRRGLNRFLLGSVSQAVALHAKCSVEIVRSKPLAENTR